MHAPSVGEGLQARVVLDLVRRLHPEIQLAYTFFSPSAEAFARGLNVDFADYLPFDTAGDVNAALNALRPTALVFSKLDVWPVLVRETAARGVKLGLVSGTLSDSSTRTGRLARLFLHEAYEHLSAVGAISPEDAQRIAALGTPADRIRVTGDTRYDQAWERASGADVQGPLLAPLVSERPTLVAGSTWPPDESVLFQAWPEVRRHVTGARLIIAPHEPSAAHLDPIAGWAGRLGLSLKRLGEAGAGSADVILVDRVGVLGDLYALATVAFVGGGFHGAGLHSVLEPAAFGAPVVFGPRHANSRDATLLHESGGGASVTNATEATTLLIQWLGDPEARAAAGAAARALVEQGKGAAGRSLDLVMQLLMDR